MKPLRFILTAMAFAVCFLLEDNYGYQGTKISIIFYAVYGISLFFLLSAAAFFLARANRRHVKVTKNTRLILLLLVLSLLIGYLSAGLQGHLGGGTEGTGLMLARISIMMIMVYYSVRVAYQQELYLSRFVETFAVFAVGSAVMDLLTYLFGSSVAALHLYDLGRITTFEGPLLIVWIFALDYFLSSELISGHKWYRVAAVGVMLLAILFSFRRAVSLIALGSIVLMLVTYVLASNQKRRIKRIAFVGPAVFLLACFIVFVRPDIIERVDPFVFLNPSSSASQVALLSNEGHVNDILIGIQLVAHHPVFGVGPSFGISQEQLYGSTIAPALLHSELLDAWLRGGVLGVAALLILYVTIASSALDLLRQGNTPFGRTFGLASFSFIIPYAMTAVVMPPFYLFQKSGFLFMVIFASGESLSLMSKQDRTVLRKRRPA